MKQVFNPHGQVDPELKEHETMLQDLRIVLKSDSGKAIFKYFFKHFEVGGLPPIGMLDNLKDDYIGFLRAGQSIFELVSQADDVQAGLLLAQIQKEKFDVQDKTSANG